MLVVLKMKLKKIGSAFYMVMTGILFFQETKLNWKMFKSCTPEVFCHNYYSPKNYHHCFFLGNHSFSFIKLLLSFCNNCKITRISGKILNNQQQQIFIFSDIFLILLLSISKQYISNHTSRSKYKNNLFICTKILNI